MGNSVDSDIKIVGAESEDQDQKGPTSEPRLTERLNQKELIRRLSTMSRESINSSEYFKKSEFLDPLVRINQMKFMTSADIGIANNVKFACLDIRARKAPRLTDIFKQPSMARLGQTQKATDFVPVLELEGKPGEKLAPQQFQGLVGYHIVIVLTGPLDAEYQGKKTEHSLFRKVQEALRRRSFVGVL